VVAGEHLHREGDRHRRDLALTLSITAAFCVVELVGGWVTNSLALLSDAGHMFADVAALGISLFAMRLSRRPATAAKSFGYHRAEILAAFVNGLALWLIVGLIWHEAYTRIAAPPLVHTSGMIAIATLGLVVNLLSLLVLRHSHSESLNLHAAFVHVLGDALGSIGAIIAGVVMWSSGWYLADPLASVAIGLLILYSSWGIVRESVDILMQGTPRELQLDDIERCLLEIGGVCQVHDLHVWTMTSGVYLLSVHLVISRESPSRAILDTAQLRLRDQFGISHSTVQLDPEDACAEEFRAH
jgi:cobalt-zinc-cadmium efflux system protein